MTQQQTLRLRMEGIRKRFGATLALDGVELDFTRGALETLARRALEKELGARGLRALLEHVMAPIMFDAPEQQHRRVSVDERWVARRLRDG